MKPSLILTFVGTFVVVVGLTFALILTGNDASSLLNALPAIAGTIGTLISISLVGNRVETVKTQTNGTLSALRAQNAALQAHNSALLTVITPEQASVAASSVPVATPNA